MKNAAKQSFCTITTFYIVDNDEKRERTRTIGWFWTETEARVAVRNNYGDWVETGYYNHAVVQKWSKVGLYIQPDNEWWYKIEMPEGGTLARHLLIKECDRPVSFNGIGGYGAFG